MINLYKRFKRYYEGLFYTPLEMPHNLFLRFLKYFLVIPLLTLPYAGCRSIEACWEALVQHKQEKAKQIGGAFALSLGYLVIGACGFVGVTSMLQAITTEISLLAGGIISLALVAPIALYFVGYQFVLAKHEAMKNNLENDGTSNPQKHSEIADLNRTPDNTELTLHQQWQIVAERARSQIKYSAFNILSKERFTQTETITVADEDVDVPEGTPFAQVVYMESDDNIDTVISAISDIQNGTATTTRKKETLLYYYDKNLTSHRSHVWTKPVLNDELRTINLQTLRNT